MAMMATDRLPWLFGGAFPSQQEEQTMGILGKQSGAQGLLGDPLFNLGIGMLSNQSPHFSNALASGLQGLQGGLQYRQDLRRQQEQDALNKRYREAQIEALRARTQNPMASDKDIATARLLFPNDAERQREYLLDLQKTSAQKNYEFRANLSPEQQQAYDDTQRAMQFQTVNQVPTQIRPDGMRPLSTLESEAAAAARIKQSEEEGKIRGQYGDSGRPSAGQTALDQAFAKQYADYVAAGGYADAQKNIGQLREVAKQLEDQDNLTGPLVGSLQKVGGAFLAPEATDARQLVEEVVQRNLRQILGPQFTEREGTRLIERAYNPLLGEETNRKRLNRLIQQMEEAAKSKDDASRYFEQNGTLRGWKGKLWTIDDFNPEGDANAVDWNDLPEGE